MKSPVPKVDPATEFFARFLVEVGSLDGLARTDALRARTARVVAAFDLDPADYDVVSTQIHGQGYKLDEATTNSLEQAVVDLASNARRAGCAYLLAAPAGYNGYASRASSGFILPFIVGGLASPDGTFSQGALVVGRGLRLIPRAAGVRAFDEALVEWCAKSVGQGEDVLPPPALREPLAAPGSSSG